MRKFSVFLATGALAGAMFVAPVAAQEAFPTQPVRVIIPFSAGGQGDTVARLFQQALERNGLLGQPLVIVNQPGAGSGIGSRAVKDAPPDGHTILLLHQALLSTYFTEVIDFTPDEFETIAETSVTCNALITLNDSGLESLEDVIERAREQPGSVRNASMIGGTVHFAHVLMEDKADIQLGFVNTGGGAERLNSVLGGHTEISLATVSTAARMGDTVRAIAYFGPERHPRLPEVPTAIEQGIDVSDCINNWWLAPKGTPPERIEIIAEALESALEDEELRAALENDYQIIGFKGPEETRTAIQAEFENFQAAAEILNNAN